MRTNFPHITPSTKPSDSQTPKLGSLGRRSVQQIPSNHHLVGCGPNMFDGALKALIATFLVGASAIVFFATAYFTGSALAGAAVTSVCALAFFAHTISSSTPY